MPASKIERTMFNIVTDYLARLRDFSTTLLALEPVYESDWYIVLVPREGPRFELGIIKRSSDVTPLAATKPPGGGYLTFVVEEVLVAFGQAKAMKAEIIEPPVDTTYGQRRMLLRDPAGTVIDISSPTPTMNA